MKITKIKKLATLPQQDNKKKSSYTVRAMLDDLLKWENFLKTVTK